MRKGLRICGHRGNPEVRCALVRYARWLRKNYDFPVRVPVYLFPSETVITQDGDHVSASFFWPLKRSEEPFIRIATGDYPFLKRTRGRDNALSAYILSLSHELIHYFQWIRKEDVTEKGVVVKARKIFRQYASEVARP